MSEKLVCANCEHAQPLFHSKGLAVAHCAVHSIVVWPSVNNCDEFKRKPVLTEN